MLKFLVLQEAIESQQICTQFSLDGSFVSKKSKTTYAAVLAKRFLEEATENYHLKSCMRDMRYPLDGKCSCKDKNKVKFC